MAAILQGKESVFETDQFQPLIELGEELSGRRYGEQAGSDRALRILADHARAMTFLMADGVVPSNEDRGYVLRRVMRRAILQGRALELEPGFLRRYGERVREVMGAAYPELGEQADAIDTWLARRGGGLRAHARAGLANLTSRSSGPARPGASGSRPRTPSAARHVRVPVRPHAASCWPRRGSASTRRASSELMDAQRERGPRGRRRRRAGRAEPRASARRAFAGGTGCEDAASRGYETDGADDTRRSARRRAGRTAEPARS